MKRKLGSLPLFKLHHKTAAAARAKLLGKIQAELVSHWLQAALLFHLWHNCMHSACIVCISCVHVIHVLWCTVMFLLFHHGGLDRVRAVLSRCQGVGTDFSGHDQGFMHHLLRLV
jgi:hypothetical protein